jgi:hypothetical protein
VAGYIEGTDSFTRLAARMRAAGSEGKGLRREITKSLREGAAPLVREARDNVTTLNVSGRGGASARAARAAHALRNRRRASERVKQRAHQRAGLRTTVANAVSAQVKAGGSSPSLRVRAAQAAMPPDQRRLPRYLNKGSWRHPVFGNDSRWVTQTAPPAWFDDAAKRQGPIVRGRTLNTVDNYLQKLV